jgi:glycosyltransferase involved in cell wall biosynthesis
LKNILELCLSPDLGGLELYMVRASHFLHERTKVVSVINKSGKLGQYYKDTKYHYESLARSSTLLSFLTARKLAKIIDVHKIEVVHLHWTKDIPVAVLAKLFSKQKPKLVQTRNMTMTRFKDDFYHRFLYKNMDLMLPVTHQVKGQLEKFIPLDIRPKVNVLYMGAQTPEKIQSDEKSVLRQKYELSNSFTVGIVGRIEEDKGQYLVIDAVKKLLHDEFDVKALIVGSPMHDDYLEALKVSVKKDAIEKNIIFTGFTTQAQKLMQVCDVVVLATRRETFGLVLIEAMKSGVAVIGTNNAGPLEIIDDNETGLLFTMQDSNSLAEKVKLLIENEEFKNKLARAGKEKAMKVFDSEIQFEKLFGVLNES